MRFQPVKETAEQRAAVRGRLQELLQPEAALAVIRRCVPSDRQPIRAHCSPVQEGRNRFVLRAEFEMVDGTRATYALKGYLDGHGEQIGEFYRTLSRYWVQLGKPCPVIQPLAYLRDENLLVIPWAHGVSLAEAIRAARADIVEHAIAHAPRALAQLHATEIVPEAPTTARAMVQFTVERWDLQYARFPDARALVMPLVDLLQAALVRLEPSSSALVHGDAGPGHFLLDGGRWLLLDLDTYGYADPAYDAGYLLARLEYECLRLPALAAQATRLVTMMHRTCLQAMPDISSRNVAFFYSLTLIRKVLSFLFKVSAADRNARWPAAVAHVAARARTALSTVLSGTNSPLNVRRASTGLTVRRPQGGSIPGINPCAKGVRR
jgi:Phosphotransferase enzyme family